MPNVYTALTGQFWSRRSRSRSSNNTVDSENVDSVSLGILLELWYELLQESDVAILVLVIPSVSYAYITTVSLHVGIVVQSVLLTRFKG